MHNAEMTYIRYCLKALGDIEGITEYDLKHPTFFHQKKESVTKLAKNWAINK